MCVVVVVVVVVVLHDLVLREASSRLCPVHGVGMGAFIHVLDEGDAQGPAAVLIPGEFG